MCKSKASSPWRKLLGLVGLGEKKKCRGVCSHNRRNFQFEPLEERQLLSVCVWDGGGSDNNWMTAANWAGDIAPVAGDDLQFAGTVRTATQNNFTAGTNFNSVEFTNNGFSLSGNDITLTGGVAVDVGVSGSTISLNAALSGSITVDVASGQSLTISGCLTGTGDLTTSGDGTLVLSGSNSYSGGTTIWQGDVVFEAGGLGSSGTVAINGVATLEWFTGNTEDISSRLSIASGVAVTLDVGANSVVFETEIASSTGNLGYLTKAGTGTLTLAGNDQFAGVTISQGTLAVGNTISPMLHFGDIVNNGELVFDSTNTLSVSGAISGCGTVIQQGTGKLIFAGTNTYSGGTTINAGSLIVGAAGAAASSYTLTAQLSARVAGESVTFIDDTASTVIGTAKTDASGVASINYVFAEDATPTAHSVRAVYGGTSQNGTLSITLASMSEWSHRKQITISHAHVDADLTDFPLCVKITDDSEIGANSLSNGYDIRFTSADGTLLNYERESWTGGGGAAATANFWVKVPTISSTTDTTIYIYYGKSNAPDGQTPSAVWDSNYKGVWHFNSNLDSTSNGYTLSASGTPSQVTGEVGNAVSFNGTNYYYTTGPSPTGALTLEAWVKTTQAATKGIFGKWGSDRVTNAGQSYQLYFTANGYAGGLVNSTNSVDVNTSTTTIINDGAWHQVVLSAAAPTGTIYVYVDGVQRGSLGNNNPLLATTTDRLIIGAVGLAGGETSITGSLDDIRISSTNRSAAWIKFEYFNTVSATNELSWTNDRVSSLAISPSTASATSPITLSAQLSSATAGNVVTFIDDATSAILGTAVTDASGAASLTYLLPIATTTGTHAIRAVYGATSQAASLTVTAPDVSGWLYRKEITISKTNVTSDLANFPLYVKIANDADIGAASLANGYDIRFTAADGTILSYERESWTGGGGSAATGNFWVKVPVISSAADTTIYVYYGKANIADGQNPSAVWDSSYKGVWHLEGTSDSTSNGYTLLASGTPTQVTGEAGNATSFNGSNYYYSTTGPSPTGTITLEAWVKTNQAAGKGIFGKWGSDRTTNAGQSYQLYCTPNGYAAGLLNSTNSQDVAVTTTTTINDNAWHHVVLSASAPTGMIYVYVDGVQRGSLSNSNPLLATTTDRLLVGATSLSGGSYQMAGLLDDIRISSTNRSASWIKFEYCNVSSGSNELTWSSQQSNSSGAIVQLSSLAVAPAPAAAGMTVTLTAQLSTALAGETVTFTDVSGSITIGQAQTNSSGVATITYVVPANATNAYVLRATYGTSTASVTTDLAPLSVRHFTITPTPTNGSLGTGNITNNASVVFNCSSTVNLTSTIEGAGSVTQKGPGVLILASANSYSGGTTLNAGTIQLGNSAALGNSSGVLILTGGTLDLHGYDAVTGPLSGTGGKITDNSSISGVSTLAVTTTNGTSFSGIIQDGNARTVALTKRGVGVLTLTGANAYTGATTIQSGTLAVGATNSLPTATTVILGDGSDSGVLQLGSGGVAYNQAIAGLTTSGTGSNNRVVGGATSNATLTLNISGGTVSYGGILGGSNTNQNNLALVKAGAGTFVLSGDSGANTYTGATTVSAGVLQAKSTSALPGYNTSGRVVANSGGTIAVNVGGVGEWALASIQTLLSSVTFNSGSSLGMDTTAATADFVYGDGQPAISGALGITKLGTGTLVLTGSNTYTGSTIVRQGTLRAAKIVVSSGNSNLGTGTSAVVLGDGVHKGILAYTGTTPASSLTRGFTVNAGGGEFDVLTAGQTVTLATGGISSGGQLTIGGAGNTTISSTISGTGSLTKTGDGTLTLSGTTTYSGGTNVDAGTLNLTGTMTNSGSTVNLANGTGVLILTGTIIGGTVTANRDTAVQITGVGVRTLDGVTLNANTTVQEDKNLTVKNGFTLNGTLTIASTWSNNLLFVGTQTLGGTGQVVTNNSNNIIIVQGVNSSTPATLTVAEGITIHGQGTIRGTYTGDNLVNHGTILADSANATLTTSVALSNSGTLACSGSGNLVVSSLLNNTGIVRAGTNSTDTGTLALGGGWTSSGSLTVNGGVLTLGGTWANTAGSLAVNNGTLNLAGNFSSTGLGSLTYNAGTVNLTGVMANTGNTLCLGSSTGVWNLKGGRITGGTVTATAGPWLSISSSGGTLDGVTLHADLGSPSGGTLAIWNGLTLDGTVSLPSNAAVTLLFAGTQSLTGTGQLVMGNSSDLLRIQGSGNAEESSATLTVGSDVTIHGQGTISGYYSNDKFINNGTILVTNSSLALGGKWDNTNGTLSITSGTLTFGGAFTTAGLGNFNYTSGTVNVTGVLNNSGSTLTLDSNTGIWNLDGGTIVGGTVNVANGASIHVTHDRSSTLDGVTLNGKITILDDYSLNVKNGLTLNGAIDVSTTWSNNLYFVGTQTISGAGQINVPLFNNDILVKGTNSTTPATVTIGEGITVRGQGEINSVYTGDTLLNQGNIVSDIVNGTLSVTASLINTGSIVCHDSGHLVLSNLQSNSGKIQSGINALDAATITLGGTLTNYGEFIAIGRSALSFSGTTVQGSLVPVSGTELRLGWHLSNDSTQYTVERSDDGVSYVSLADIANTKTEYVADNLWTNSFHHIRVAETNTYGGRVIYEGGAVATQDRADESGWYRLDYIRSDETGEAWSDPYAPAFTLNNAPIFAGSQEGTVLRALEGLVRDGSTPTIGADGTIKVYQVIRTGCESQSMIADNGSSLMGPALSEDSDLTLASCAASPMAASAASGSSTYTFSPSGYTPSYSVAYNFISNTICLAGNAAYQALKSLVNFSDDPIRYSDGAVDYSATDIASTEVGGFSQTRSWTNTPQWSPFQYFGDGWVNDSLPTIQEFSDGSVTITRSGTNQTTFALQNGQYVPLSYVSDTLVRDTTNNQLVYNDSDGNTIRFSDFRHGASSELTAAVYFYRRGGVFQSMTNSYGIVTEVVSRTSSDAVQEVRSRDMLGNDLESWLYLYGTSGSRLTGVQLRKPDGQGNWTIVQQVSYEYYGANDPSGNPGDLKLVSQKDASGNVINTSYYRYYQRQLLMGLHASPIVDELKYVFDSASYARLVAAVGDPSAASDEVIAPYATHYFAYDAQRRCTRHDIQGTGGPSTGGVGTFTYAYYDNPNFEHSWPSDNNTWRTKTIETLPDGNQNILYCNRLGQVMLKVFQDVTDTANPSLSGHEWLTYRQFDSLGQTVLEAEPSAVTGYQVSNSVLTVSLSANSGLIYLNDYYTTTTATATTAGGIKGYLQNSKIKRGAFGTPILQESKTYYRKTAGTSVSIVTASDTVYRNSDGTGGETINYSYNWYSNTSGVQSATQTQPIVTTAQNGSNSADTATVCYDAFGRPIWMKDADGYLTYIAYDSFSGAVVKRIIDVDATKTSDFTGLPAGWATPIGGGKHLVSTWQVDNLGRPVEYVDAEGNITYTVYKDSAHEIRSYAGWSSTTHNTSGPIAVLRSDQNGNYFETLTYTWSGAAGLPVDSSGRPTGQESWSDSNATLQSLSRSLLNSANQEVATRSYFNLAGITYSTTRNLGTKGVNYLETTTAYGVWGESLVVTDPNGLINKKLYDSLGRLTKVLVGTNDTPGSSNMATVEEYVYDNNAAGDDNVTRVTIRPSNGEPDRVTELVYDWRDRLIASKDGVQVTEDTSTNRPITYYVLDNLGETLDVSTYDGDGVSLASLGLTTGVPNAPSASLLRSKSTAAYDNLGRAYQISDMVIDQASGDVLAAQTTHYWYGRRGQLLKTRLANGSVTKNQYDSVGRLVLQATTDGGGDTGWADADDLTGDTIVSQVQYGYDDNGNRTSVIDALNHTTSYTYDSLNRLRIQTDANSATTEYQYDAAGRLHSLTDSEDNTTTWAYDLLGRTTQETNALNATCSYAYNSVGQLASKTDYDGRVTTYNYNDLGQRTAENWLDGQQSTIRTFSYSYNRLGELETASDPSASYDYAYNVLGQLTATEESIDGLTPDVVLSQQFNATGDRTQLASTIGGTADLVNDYSYNGLGEMTSVRQHGATGGNAVAEKRVDFTYDAAGQFSTLTRYADLAGTQTVAESDFTFDLAGRLTELAHSKGATTLAGHSWTYDSAGRITQYVNTLDGTVDYTNDDTGQLTGADYDYQTDESYTYDDNGNRTNTGYVTGTNNRLLSDGAYRYTYDAEGNRTAKFIDADADGVLDVGDTDITSYTWDHRDRMTEVRHFASYTAYAGELPDQVVSYSYDYANRLVRKTVDSDGDGTVDRSTAFVYDGNQILQQFDHAGTGPATAADLAQRYLWGPAVDQLLAQESSVPLEAGQGEGFDLSTPGDVVWLLTDNLGTVRDLAQYDSNTDTTTVANHRVYDAYGNLKSETNAAVDCLFGYTARPFDSDTGLQNNLNRWYDPKVGRWASEDPIGFAGHDTNISRYVGNSPTSFSDPNGLCWNAAKAAAAWSWNNIGAPLAQTLADLLEGTTTDFIIGVDNLAIFLANGGMELLNDLARMSLYGQPIFAEPIPYFRSYDWSRGLFFPESDWMHNSIKLAGEMFGPLALSKLAGSAGIAEIAAEDSAFESSLGPAETVPGTPGGLRSGSVSGNPANRLMETGTPLKNGEGWAKRWTTATAEDVAAQDQAIFERYQQVSKESRSMPPDEAHTYNFEQMQKFRTQYRQQFLKNRNK